MKALLYIAAISTTIFSTGQALAESTSIDIDKLQFETVYETAERGILVRDGADRPFVMLLKLDDGDFLPPHGAGGGLRLLTVLSGELSWGDGGDVDPDAEKVFPAGTILVLPAQAGEHWAAARNGDVLLQVIVLRGGTLAPDVAEQVADSLPH